MGENSIELDTQALIWGGGERGEELPEALNTAGKLFPDRSLQKD